LVILEEGRRVVRINLFGDGNWYDHYDIGSVWVSIGAGEGRGGGTSS